MKKKILVGLIALMALALFAPSVFAKGWTVGVVIPYEIGWFTGFHNGFQIIANAQGDKLVFAYHGYQADKETEAVQNLIAQGVDAINVTAVTPQSAEYSCRLANEAGIPYAAIAMSTDYDCWKTDEEPVSWEQVLETFSKNVHNVTELLVRVIGKL